MNLISAIASHFFGDFPCQTEYMALNKGKSWEWMIYHALVYTAVFVLFGATPFQAIILFTTHMVIDPMKARWKIINHIWLDQALHLTVIALLFA